MFCFSFSVSNKIPYHLLFYQILELIFKFAYQMEFFEVASEKDGNTPHIEKILTSFTLLIFPIMKLL